MIPNPKIGKVASSTYSMEDQQKIIDDLVEVGKALKRFKFVTEEYRVGETKIRFKNRLGAILLNSSDSVDYTLKKVKEDVVVTISAESRGSATFMVIGDRNA